MDHSLGLTPDEHDVSVCDTANQRPHAVGATAVPPRQAARVPLR